MENPWYATWFNTPHYHDLYKHHDLNEARDFIHELCDQLDIQPGDTALDIACGRGRHAKVLADRGLNTTGIDLSSESIDYAKKFSHHGLRFQVGDMLDPIDHAPVNWVFNLFTSFGYFEDDALHQQAISHMAQALLPGGRLVLDYMNAQKIAAQLVPANTVHTDRNTYHITRKIEGNTIVKTIQFTEDCHVNYYEERVRAFTPEELLNFIKSAGLQPEEVHGDYNLSAFDPEQSDRLLIIAQKPA